MSARYEIVRTSRGYYARFIAGNGRELWATGTYPRRRTAVNAVAVIGDAPSYSNGRDADLIEVRDVDHRPPPPKPVTPEFPIYHTVTYLGGTKAYWHDREMHYRNCYGDDCTEATPPAGVTVQCRGAQWVVPF